MKRKLTIFAIGLFAVAALTMVYTAGWLKGQAGQFDAPYHALEKRNEA